MDLIQKFRSKQIERLTEGVFPTQPMTEEQMDKIFTHLQRKTKAEQRTNVELADLLLESQTYGSTVVLSDDMIILDEIIRRLINGKIPEHWEVEGEEV